MYFYLYFLLFFWRRGTPYVKDGQCWPGKFRHQLCLFKKVIKLCKIIYFNNKYRYKYKHFKLLFFFKNLCVTLFPTLGFGSSLMDVSIAPALPSRYSNSFSVRFIPRNSRGPTNWPFRVPWTINNLFISSRS